MPNKAPDFEILLNGFPLDENAKLHVESIEYIESLESTGSLTFIINDTPDFFLSPNRLRLKNSIELWMGYVGNLTTVFTGTIEKVSPHFRKDNCPQIKITAYDRSYDLKRIPPPRLWNVSNPKVAAEELLSKYGLSFFVDPLDVLVNYHIPGDKTITQIDQPDWEVLSIIARIGNYNLFVKFNTVYMVDDNFTISRSGYTAKNFIYNPEESDLYDSLNSVIIDWQADMGSMLQRVTCDCISWGSVGASGDKYGTIRLDEVQKHGDGYTEVKVQSSFDDDIIETIRIPGKTARTEAQARRLAMSELQRRADNLVDADCEVLGDATLQMGQQHYFKLNGLDKFGLQYSGNYIIKSVRHTLTRNEGFNTKLELRRDGLTPV